MHQHDDSSSRAHSDVDEPATGKRAENPEKADVSPIPSTTDWNDANDPDDPHNWSLALRIYHVVIPSLFGFAV
jgi:hypothetical protein